MIEEFLTGLEEAVGDLSLALGATALPVVRGRQPKQEEGKSANAQITLHALPRTPHDTTRWNNKNDLHKIRARVVLWTPGNIDGGSSALTAAATTAQHSAWEIALVNALDHKPANLLGIDGMRDLKASVPTYLDRGAFGKGWDVQVVEVEAQVVRARP